MLRQLLSLGLLVFVNCNEYPELEIDDGRIKGSILKSEEGRPIFAFRGIPFAEPPLGALRFKPPVPVKPWKNVVDATKSHAICPQRDIIVLDKANGGTEDCLFLNVYTPRLPSKNSEPLPVLVFFHGGAFNCGTGDYLHYAPDLFLDRDIVLVIGNYRLGALGFLSTGDEAAPGNYGLKDQSLLLKWVNKNIEHFGGDPRNVTLFGESAGGASSNFHMFSPLSRGLFQRVISQSGSVFNSWALAPKGENIKNAKILAESVNCSTSSSEELVECLRNIDPYVLLDQDAKFLEWDKDPVIPFKPVVEPPSAEAFITDTPYNLLKTGKFEDVPWIIGMTKMEGLLRTIDFLKNPKLLDDLNEDFNNKAAISLIYKPTARDIDSVGEQIKKFYFDGRKIDVEKSFPALTDMYSDAWFTEGIDEAIRSFREVSNNPVFSYIFDHNGPLSLSNIFSSSDKFHGSCHGDDLLYQFPNIRAFFQNKIESDDDKKFIKYFTTLWTNFAKTGNPTPEMDNVIRTKWEPVTSDKLEHFYISPNIQEMRDVLFEDRVKFWRSLPSKPRKLGKDEL